MLHRKIGSSLVLKSSALALVVLTGGVLLLWSLPSSLAGQSEPGGRAVGSPFSPKAPSARRPARQSASGAASQRPATRENFDIRVGHQRTLAAPPEAGAAATGLTALQPGVAQSPPVQ